MNSPALPANIHSTGHLPKVVSAKGCYLTDVNGKTYIDGSGGPAVYCIGHANEEVNEAIKQQLDRIAHGYRYNFTTDALVAQKRLKAASSSHCNISQP
jgi:adenosylmethionine-8-amino-7-oxononanoate aminotransferase